MSLAYCKTRLNSGDRLVGVEGEQVLKVLLVIDFGETFINTTVENGYCDYHLVTKIGYCDCFALLKLDIVTALHCRKQILRLFYPGLKVATISGFYCTMRNEFKKSIPCDKCARFFLPKIARSATFCYCYTLACIAFVSGMLLEGGRAGDY